MKTTYALFLIVKRAKWFSIGLAIMVVLSFPHQDALADQAPVNLGLAEPFAVLASSTITSTNGGTINGDVGVSPGSVFVYGDPVVVVNGTVYLADPTAAQAQADLTNAYNDAAGRLDAILTTADIGGQTLSPGLYQAPVSLAITGNLTLDAGGNPNAVWIFQMASTLTVANNGQVILAGGAQARNVFWQVGSSATIGTNSIVQGNILATAAITLQAGAMLEGRALAIGAAVTLDGNYISSSPAVAIKKATNGQDADSAPDR